MSNARLAELAREHAAKAPRGSPARRAWLSAAICLQTTSTVIGAERVLVDVPAAGREDARRALRQIAEREETAP